MGGKADTCRLRCTGSPRPDVVVVGQHHVLHQRDDRARLGPSVGLHDGHPDGRHPGDGRPVRHRDFRARRQPAHGGPRAREEVAHDVHGDGGEVDAGGVDLVVGLVQIHALGGELLGELLLDLLLRSDEGDTVHAGHHGALDDAAVDAAVDQFGRFVVAEGDALRAGESDMT